MVFKHQQKRVPLYITKKNRINYTMTDCYIYDAVRTPRGKGKATGRLHAFTPLNLITQVLKALQSRLDLDTSQVDDIILGCVEPVQEQGANIARSAALNAGYNQSVPGVQINRFCASGLEAINMAAAKVMSGQSDLMIAGGVESLSRIPIGSSLGALGIDPCFTFDHYIIPQGISADLIATLDQLSRKDVDQYAVSSQQRAGNAWEKGYFNQSVIPIKDSLGHVALDKDEILRPETTLDDLAGLKLSFKDLGEMFGFDSVAIQRYPEVEQIQHVHHAGNSSGITDGAVIEASDLNNEFDQLLAAFVASTGHTHDGTAAEGGPITKLLGTAITIGDGTSGTVTNNWLTLNAPDILLYGALMEAEPFIKNDERIPVWLQAYRDSVDKIQKADARDRHSGSAMRVRNIYSGVEG